MIICYIILHHIIPHHHGLWVIIIQNNRMVLVNGLLLSAIIISIGDNQLVQQWNTNGLYLVHNTPLFSLFVIVL